MAVDTRDKRFSLISFGSPIPNVLPNPDGSFNAADRAMLIFLYHGLALSAPSILTIIGLVSITFTSKQPGLAFTSKQPGIAFED